MIWGSVSLWFFLLSWFLVPGFRYFIVCLLIFAFLFILHLPFSAYIDLVVAPICKRSREQEHLVSSVFIFSFFFSEGNRSRLLKKCSYRHSSQLSTLIFTYCWETVKMLYDRSPKRKLLSKTHKERLFNRTLFFSSNKLRDDLFSSFQLNFDLNEIFTWPKVKL